MCGTRKTTNVQPTWPTEYTHCLFRWFCANQFFILIWSSNSVCIKELSYPGRKPGRTWATRWIFIHEDWTCELAQTLHSSALQAWFLVLRLLPYIHCINCSRLNQVWSSMSCRRGRRAWPTASTADPLHHHDHPHHQHPHQHHHESHLQCQQSMCLINVKSCILLNKPDKECDAIFSNLSIRALHICLDPTPLSSPGYHP